MDYERLQVLELYACGQMTAEAALRNFGGDSLEELHRQLRAEGLQIKQGKASAAISAAIA